jgi:hypothetical protein
MRVALSVASSGQGYPGRSAGAIAELNAAWFVVSQHAGVASAQRGVPPGPCTRDAAAATAPQATNTATTMTCSVARAGLPKSERGSGVPESVRGCQHRYGPGNGRRVECWEQVDRRHQPKHEGRRPRDAVGARHAIRCPGRPRGSGPGLRSAAVSRVTVRDNCFSHAGRCPARRVGQCLPLSHGRGRCSSDAATPGSGRQASGVR